jgi:glyoxylase-like metal-dependent hydrolase (beta-lactamase superfamily II)
VASEGHGDRHAWAATGVEDLGDGLYRIPLPLPGDALHSVNVYAMVSSRGVDLIDSGMAIVAAREKLVAALASIGCDLGDIRNFFITHIHQDHYTLAAELRTTLAGGRGARLISLGEGEKLNLEAIRESQATLQPPGFITMLPSMGAQHLVDWIKEHFGTEIVGPLAHFEWTDPDQWLTDGSVLDLGPRTLRAINTPGHTGGTWCSTTRRVPCCSPATTCCRTSPRRSASSRTSAGWRWLTTSPRCGWCSRCPTPGCCPRTGRSATAPTQG